MAQIRSQKSNRSCSAFPAAEAASSTSTASCQQQLQTSWFVNVRDVGTFQEPFYTSNRFSCFHSQAEFVLSHDIQHAHVMPHSPVLGETPAGFHGHLAKSPNIAKEGLLGKAIALKADPQQSSNKFLQGKKSSNSLNTASGVKFDYIALLRRIATHPA